ncbi:MAG: hypothetical protein H0W25_03395 [Acidimicrobiia bacterium]|nr:hypothetical protein [Acidimicrobiia bacterium]
MSMISNTTGHHAAVAQHHDYTADLVSQLVALAEQTGNVAQQLKDGHSAMGSVLEESMNNLLNEPAPTQ